MIHNCLTRMKQFGIRIYKEDGLIILNLKKMLSPKNPIKNLQLDSTIPIASPISGETSFPRIHKVERGGKIYTEAHWICPASGAFIRKGIVSIEDVKR